AVGVRVDDAIRRVRFRVILIPIRPDEDGVTVLALAEVSGAVHVVALLLVPVDRVRHNTRQGSDALVGRNLERARARGIGAGPRVPDAVAQRAGGVCAVRSAGLRAVWVRPSVLPV